MGMITGNELKAIRNELRWTQAKLAEELGVSRPTVVGWEKRGDGYLDHIVFLATQALVRLPDTRRLGDDGHLTFGSEKL